MIVPKSAQVSWTLPMPGAQGGNPSGRLSGYDYRLGLSHELFDQLACRQIAHQRSGLTRPERHEGGPRLLARQLLKRADETPLQRKLQ